MKIIVCVGDNNAMLFHNRRISRDRAVIEDILRMVSKEVKKDGRARIWMNEYSSELFRTYSGIFCVRKIFGRSWRRGVLFVEMCRSRI